MIIEKGPGWDWNVTYEDDEGQQVMTVFGFVKIEDAVMEARRSLSSWCDGAETDPGPAITKVERVK